MNELERILYLEKLINFAHDTAQSYSQYQYTIKNDPDEYKKWTDKRHKLKDKLTAHLSQCVILEYV